MAFVVWMFFLGFRRPFRDLIQKILDFLKKLSKELNPTAEIK
jgi:hypothetical protein